MQKFGYNQLSALSSQLSARIVSHNNTNILLTSAGRRSYLVKYFQEALNGSGQVHAANSSPLSPAMQAADKSVITPIIYSNEYIPFLLDYCKANNISLVIPLFDIDLPVLAANREKFHAAGVTLLVSDENFVRTCNDKWSAYNFLKANGFTTAPCYITLDEAENALASGEIHYPVIIKPRWGMGSLAIYRAENLDELRVLYRKSREKIQSSYLKYESAADLQHSVLIQKIIDGQEYGADIFHDFHGNHRGIVIRKKLAMRSGETDCAETVDEPSIHAALMKLSALTGHVGNLDVDVFLSGDDVYILEMNPRFGGGYPFSHAAGVNFPLAIVKWLRGEEPDSAILCAKTGVVAQKDISILKLDTVRS